MEAFLESGAVQPHSGLAGGRLDSSEPAFVLPVCGVAQFAPDRVATGCPGVWYPVLVGHSFTQGSALSCRTAASWAITEVWGVCHKAARVGLGRDSRSETVFSFEPSSTCSLGASDLGVSCLRLDECPLPTRLETRTKESNMCASLEGVQARRRNEGEAPGGWGEAGGWPTGPVAPPSRPSRHVGWAEVEHTRWDPKDGELCLNRMKPGETLVEVRSDSDVQIDRLIWV